MVQTVSGVIKNDWIVYMRECAAHYRARKKALEVSNAAKMRESVVTPTIVRSPDGREGADASGLNYFP